MTKQEFKTKLHELKDFMYRREAISEAICEGSPTPMFGGKLIDNHIEMLSKAVVDPEGRIWWFIFENDWGTLEREINGVPIRTADDLYKLIDNDVRSSLG